MSNLVEYDYKNIHVFPTDHSTERAMERELSDEIDKLQNHYESTINYILSSDYSNKNQDYMAYSNYFQRGFIYNFNGTDKLTVITVLPQKPKARTFSKKGTKKIAVESELTNIPNDIKHYIVDIFSDLDDVENEEVILDFDGHEYNSYFIDGELFYIEDLDFIETI